MESDLTYWFVAYEYSVTSEHKRLSNKVIARTEPFLPVWKLQEIIAETVAVSLCSPAKRVNVVIISFQQVPSETFEEYWREVGVKGITF